MTALSANGAQVHATAPGSGNGVPYGDPGVGAEAPPPTPPTEADGLRARLAEAERTLDLWENWAERIKAQTPSEPTPASPKRRLTLDSLRRVPTRYVAVGLGGVFVVAVALTANRFTPQRYDAAQITAIATQAARQQAVSDVQGTLNEAAASNTQIVVPDPFAAYGLDLTEDAKTAIGTDPTTGGKTMNPKRAAVVAAQVRANVAVMPLLTMRLVSVSPTELRVTDDKSVGYPLFRAPVPQAPASLTATTTATSAP